MMGSGVLCLLQMSNSGYLQNAMIGSGAQPQALNGFFQELVTHRIQPTLFLKRSGFHLNVRKDGIACNAHLSSPTDKISEDVSRFGPLISVAHSGPQKTIKTGGYEDKLHIAVFLQFITTPSD
jgi:hypothetical protein